MSAGRDLLLFILFLVALGIAWFLTGGPTRPISHAGWFFNPSPYGTTTGIIIPSVSVPLSSSGDTSGGTAQAEIKPMSVWDYFFRYRPGVGVVPSANASPYAAYVSLNRGQIGGTDPAGEYLVLRTSQNLPQSVTVSGWTIENVSTGMRLAIGGAAPVPVLGEVNTQTPVSAGPGSTIILVTGRSPNGISFRLNECTGYFDQFQTFTPNLPEDCPSPYDEMLVHPGALSNDQACQQYVNTLGQCTFVGTASLPSGISSACYDFLLNNLSYNGCVAEHRNDAAFYKNEWRVYLNRDQALWSADHGIIDLFDENGKLVAELSY